MIEYLMNLDTEVFLFLHSGQNAFWDIAMKWQADASSGQECILS